MHVQFYPDSVMPQSGSTGREGSGANRVRGSTVRAVQRSQSSYACDMFKSTPSEDQPPLILDGVVVPRRTLKFQQRARCKAQALYQASSSHTLSKHRHDHAPWHLSPKLSPCRAWAHPTPTGVAIASISQPDLSLRLLPCHAWAYTTPNALEHTPHTPHAHI